MNIPKNIVRFALVLLCAVLCSADAWAIATPTSTTAFLYPFYKIIVLDIGAGPVMFAVGFVGLCVSAYYLYHSKMSQAFSSVVATAMIVGAAAIVPTLGMTF